MPTIPQPLANPEDPAAMDRRRRAERCLFWRSLYPRAWPFAPFLLLFRPGFFQPDHELIHGLARATTPAQFRDEINDFVLNPANASWLRHKGKLRVSTRRIERFAILCLGPSAPVAGVQDSRRPAGLAPDPRRIKRRS